MLKPLVYYDNLHIGQGFVCRTFQKIRCHCEAVRPKVTPNFSKRLINKTLTGVKSWKDFLFVFTFFPFIFKGFSTVSFGMITFCFAVSFCDIVYCLQLLLACDSHHFHLCGFITDKNFK